MNQFFMSNLMSLVNTIFPPAVRNALMELVRKLWFYINVVQLHVYFEVDEIPFLRWMCPIFEFLDAFIRLFWRFIAYILRLEVWFVVNVANLYVRVLRYAIYLFYGYSILVAVSNMEFATNIPMLEMILQNTEWIYQYAGQFIDFNVAIAKKAVENFCTVPFEQRSHFEQTIINGVNRILEQANYFISN